MSTTQKQSTGNHSPEEQQPNRIPNNDGQGKSKPKIRPDLPNDIGNSEDDKRTGTSILGNTATESFNETAEQQETDRDKNAEG